MFKKITKFVINTGKTHRFLLPLCVLALCVLFGVRAFFKAPAALGRAAKNITAGQARTLTSPTYHPARRIIALLLAVSLTLTMNSGFAFAAEEPLLTETQTSREASVTDSGKEKLTDPMGSVTEGEIPSVDAPVCTCNPALGTSSVEGHGKDCPLYAPPEKPEQGECACPPVDSGEVMHGEGCPLYEAANCGCEDGFFECYHIHEETCPLYSEPDLDELPTEMIAEQSDVPATKTLTLDENGETVDISGLSSRGRAAPVGKNYDADANASDSVNMNMLALAGTPTATMSTVINVPVNPIAGSPTLLSVRFATVGGGKVNIYFNDKKLGETYEALPKNQLTVWLPMYTSWVKSGQNTVRIELVEGSIYFRAARVLVNGGTAIPNITDPFALQYFEKNIANTGGDLFLRSGITGYTGKATFQYTSEETIDRRDHAVAGSAEFNHTVPIVTGAGTGCQIFLPDSKGDLIGYTSAIYTLVKDDGLIELDLLKITHDAAAQTPAAGETPTYSQITVMGRSNAKDLVVINCSVKEKNDSVAAKVTKVAAGSSDYTFQWSSNELTEVTYTYTQGGTQSTKTYDFRLDLDLDSPFFSTTPVSVPTRTTPSVLKDLLLAGVFAYRDKDDRNPLPIDKALTANIDSVNLGLAGNYTATITAVDAFGNTKTENAIVAVVALPVALGTVTATPEGDATALSRTFTSAITEDSGKSFTDRGFVVGYGNAPTVEDNVYKLTATGENSSFTASKSDFGSNIQYYVRAYGKDSAGVVYYSAPLGFSCGAPGDYGALTAGDLLLEIPYNGITGSATVTGNITITRPGGSAGAVSLTYEVIPGSLTTVTAASGVLQFAAGVYSKTIPISVTDAEQFNGAKSFTVKLTNPTPTTINGSTNASVTVSYTTNYLAALAAPGDKCLLKGVHTQSFESAGAATTEADFTEFFKAEDGWACNLPNRTITRKNVSATGNAYDTYTTFQLNKITATVDVSAHVGEIWAAAMVETKWGGSISVWFYSDEDATQKLGESFYMGNKKIGAVYASIVPDGSNATICTGKGATGSVGGSTERIPVGAKTAKVNITVSESSDVSGFFFGVKEEPQLAFTRFDSDIDTTRTYYPGDKLRFYPVLNSAVEPLTAAASIKVGAAVANYDPAQKAFVYTIPVGATTGALTLAHNGAKYTVKGQAAGADDWCNLTPTGSVSTAVVTMATLATVAIAPTTSGNNTTHKATVTATGNSGNVEYVWSSASTPPTGGWQTVPAGGAVVGSGYTGSMYLHAKATNVTGKTTYAVSSFTFVAHSTFEVSAAPVGWVNAVTATITTTSGTGANLVVKVNSGGSDTAVSSSYTIPSTGTYTFTATDSFGFSKKLVRSYSIDKLAPVIEVNKNGYDTSKAYLKIEGITATADDGNGSGLKTWEYAWTTVTSMPSSGWAAVPVSGIIPTQSTAGDWSVYLKAVDNADNTTAQKVGSFTISTAAPTLPTITLAPSGTTIQYSVTKGTNTIAQIITPAETIGSGVSDGKTGSFAVERNGVYTVAAVDAKGYTAEKSIVINNIDTDAPTLSAKVYSGASEAVYGTYEKSDSFRVEVTAEDEITPTYEASGQISGYYGSGLTEIKWKNEGGTDATLSLVGGTASFTITENGSYIITATDTAGNTATQTLRVKSIDNSAPVITPAAPPANGWDAVGSVVGFTVADADSGVQSVTVSKGGATVSVTGSYSFTTNGSGTYTITATDKVGNSIDSSVTVLPPTMPIVTPSVNPTLTYGDLVSVNVAATITDGGALSYQWYKGTSATDTDSSGKTPIGTATTYAQPSNASRLLAGAHYYFCVVTNTKGGATTSATSSVIAVTVQKKTPDFTFTADKNTAVHGETVKLSATVKAASGGSAPIGTVTFKDGDTVLDTVQVTRISSGTNTGNGEAVHSYAIPISSSGTLTAAYTSTDNNRYNSTAPASVTVSVSKKPLSITVTAPTNLTYNGMAKAATLGGTTGLTEGTDYTLTYTSTAYDSTTAPTDVGDYTATFALTTEGAKIYDTGASTLTVSFAIAKAVGVGSVTCADIMFGSTVTPVPASATNGIAGVTYLYKVKNANDNTYSADAPANMGDYTVKATFSATTNYKTATATADFKITPAAVAGITVTPYNGVYDGAAHPIVTVTGTQSGDKVFYQLPSSTYAETLPTVTTVADSKSVIVKVTRANHVDFVSGWNAAKVTPKVVAVDFTVPTNLVYDGDPKTVTAEITNKVGTDDVGVTLDNATGTAVGDYTTKASALTGTAAGNYKLPSPMPSVEWKIIGTPYPNEITLPTASGITYGQKLSDSTLTGDNGSTGSFTWNDDTVMPPAGSYTATVVFTPNDNNFAPVTRTVQVTVAKADVTLEVSGTKVYHAAPIANTDFVVSNISGMVNGETDTDLLGTLTFTSIGNTADAGVGNYDITIAQSGTSNYKVITTAVAGKFTVTRAVQTLSGTASHNLLLTDKDFALDVKTDSTDTDAAVIYTLTNDGSGSVTLGADGKTVHLHKTGTATITASATQTANFEAAAPLTITVTVGSMPTVRVLAPESITTTEAQIGGTVTAGTVPMTGYGLEYKKSADTNYTEVSPTETVNSNITMLTYSLVGLEKNAEYSVRIWAKTTDKTFESTTHFRTAAEQPPTGKVEGEITDNSGENTAITVTIEAGNTVIASKTVTAGGGKFTFEALPDGFYNLVADNGKYKVTRMVQVVKGGAVTDVKMEIGKTQSVVEVKGEDTPKVAVDGLPELFGNDTLFTQDNKDAITAGGTVEFKLTVEKKAAPTDAGAIDKIAEGKVGAYLDIQILKTVTDANGRAESPEQVTDLEGNMVTIVVPLSDELQGKQSYTVYRVHGGTAEKLDSTHDAAGNTLTIETDKFSTYAIAYTEKSGGDGSSGGGSSHDDDNYDFWQKVKDKINSAEDGEGLPLGYTVKAGAGSYDKMPESVMDALRKNPEVTLEITWNGGDKITIPAGGALEKDGLRFYYPLAYLAELYRNALPAELPSANKTNPETGGVWEVNAPATAVQAPAIITPKNEGTAATPEQAELERAAIEPPTAPEIATVPHIAEAADGTPNRSKAMLFTGITIMLAAAAVACGVIIWKKKHKEEAFK